MFADLPLSLLLATFAFAAATPSESLPPALTPENFNDTVAQGVWLVEHFSPYCYHCQQFAPTWEQLVKDVEKKDNPGIHLAQVNCAVHGDLCDEHNVKGYPQMNLYRNGEYKEQYTGSRSFELLSSYLDKHAEPEGKQQTSAPVVDSIPQRPLGTDGIVIELNNQNFETITNEGPTFVKFFAPWCGHCKRLAPTWKQLARHMQGKLNVAEVNCDEHGAICKSQGVQGYPMLAFYPSGAESKAEYNGGRKFDQLKAFSEKASAPPIQAIKPAELDAHIAEDSVLYLLLHTSETDVQLLKTISEASQILLGSPPVYSCISQELLKKYRIPAAVPWALLAFKDHEATIPASTFHAPPTREIRKIKEKVTPWLLTNRLPTATELTQDTFQSVMNAPHHPLVVIVAVNKDNRDKISEKLHDIDRKWRVRVRDPGYQRPSDAREVVFAWMDAERWADWMKSMYAIKASDNEDVPIIIADHHRLVYYDEDQTDTPIRLTSASVFSAIEGVYHRKIAYKHSENLVERFARALNNKIVSMEAFVFAHPMLTVFGIGAFIFVAVMAMRRFVADDVYDMRENGHVRDKGRID
ncbi:hypothetical protein HGRIS_009879 [Hohenbuehelia grisea]|uniref:Thioredoxin domain-containing protein n=1 Tax=Hohenbuehelia grisea TaxID=104357 RepID=A0ABR3J2Z8_9AGAR